MLYNVFFSANIKEKSFSGKIYIDEDSKEEAEDIIKKWFKLKKVRVTVSASQYNIADRIKEGI